MTSARYKSEEIPCSVQAAAGINPPDAQFCIECGNNLDIPKADSLAAPEESASLTSSSFAGRRQEMADLKAALEETISGLGRLLMLVGEHGIGKTRTAQTLASHAET